MIKSQLQIRKESLIPWLAGLLAIVSTTILFLDWTVVSGGATRFELDNSLKSEALLKIAWVLQILGMIAMLVCLFALVRKSLMLMAVPIGLNVLGLLFRSLADGKYWIVLVMFILTGWCFVMAVDSGKPVFKTVTIALCITSVVLTVLLCMPGFVEGVGKISSRFRPLLCFQNETATEEGVSVAWSWNVSYIVYIISYMSVLLLILFASTTQFVAETGDEKEEKSEGAAAASGDPFEAMKNLYKMNKGAEEPVKKTEEKAPEKPVYEETVRVEPEEVVNTESAASQTVEAEPVYTVPVSGSRLQKSLKEEIVYDRDQKLEHRNVVRSFSVVGMVISFLMMVGGVLFVTDVVKIQYNSICGIMLIAVGVGLFCVFGNNLTYKEYYMKTIVTERKVVHEESNWEEVLANRLEEDERSIASLTETYARMTDMYAKLLASTAELSNSVKALGMKAQQELPVSDDTERTVSGDVTEDSAAAAHTFTEEEKQRIAAELRAIEEEAEMQRAEAERLAKEQAERMRAEAERLQREEQERIAREAQERLEKEAEERLAREAQERLQREEEERIAREAEARIAKEAEERIAREAEARLAKEAEERLARETEDSARKHLTAVFGDEFGADEVAMAYEAAMAEGLSSKDIADSFRKGNEPKAAVAPDVAPVEEVVEEAAPVVEEIAPAVEEKIEEVIEEPVAEAAETVEEAVEEIAPAVEEKIEEVIEEPVAEATEAVEEVAEEIAPVAEEKIEEVIEEPVAEAAETVEEAVEEIAPAVEEIAPAFAETAEEIKDEAEDAIPDMIEPIEPTTDNLSVLEQMQSNFYKPSYEETPASNQSWFMNDLNSEEKTEKDNSPAFSFFGGLGLRDEDSESQSGPSFGFGSEQPEAPSFEFGSEQSENTDFGFGAETNDNTFQYFGNTDSAASGDEQTENEESTEDAYGTNPYGYEQVRTEREVIEDFVLPTFHGSGFDSPEESEETMEDDFYKPGYKIKSFARKNTSWMEDEEDDFGTPVGPDGMKIEEPKAPADETPVAPIAEEPSTLMDEEPELPMDEEPALPMDEEPELPMDEEPELPMDEEPDLPMDAEPAADVSESEPAEEEKQEEAEQKPAEEAAEEPEEKKEDTDRISRLQQKLAEIRKRNGEKYGGDIFIGDDDFQ